MINVAQAHLWRSIFRPILSEYFPISNFVETVINMSFGNLPTVKSIVSTEAIKPETTCSPKNGSRKERYFFMCLWRIFVFPFSVFARKAGTHVDSPTNAHRTRKRSSRCVIVCTSKLACPKPITRFDYLI